MPKFKMLSRDPDVDFTQYRTWIADEIDIDGYYYNGPKGGHNSLISVKVYTDTYTISDGYAVVDFNLPNPTDWYPIRRTLPECIYDSQLAVIDGYVYLFGGNLTDKIYRARLGRPSDWKDTGARLPTTLYGSQLAIIDGYIYLFGGNNGIATDVIYSATTSDPLTWTNHGSCLPRKLYHSNLSVLDGYIYLLGGQLFSDSTNIISRASVNDPLVWNDYSILPESLFSSHPAIIDGYVYLFGGMKKELLGLYNLPTSSIYRSPINDLISWSVDGYLPHSASFGQFITIGNDGYLFSFDKERTSSFIDGYPFDYGYVDTGSQSLFTKIFTCKLNDPLTWTLLDEYIPGEIYQSQVAIINDRLILFGGNGSSIIFVDNPIIHYDFYLPEVLNYGDITRTQYQSVSNILDLNKLLGFPYWKTDYKWH